MLDTAPTGHTLLLLDATGSYHREITRQMSEGARFVTPLDAAAGPDADQGRHRHPSRDDHPVLEAEELQDDLARAGITPWAWVVNASLTAAARPRRSCGPAPDAEAEPLTRVKSSANACPSCRC